jgi:hypothetical protein
MNKIWVRTCLINLIVAASIGALLRFAFVQEVLGLQYRYALHAHSHVAMLGWVYLILFSGLVYSSLSPAQQKSKYPALFWLTQLTVIGMLISFPIQGYGLFSIIFLVGHTLLSYIFTYCFIVDLKKNQDNGLSADFATAALAFMVLSLFGVWFLGYTMATEGKGGTGYYLSIQFFLHFQFNGWFIFGMLALFFKTLEQSSVTLYSLQAKRFFWLLFVACLLTFFISIAWATGNAWAMWINNIGVIIQLIAAFIFLQMLRKLPVRGIYGYWPGLLINIAIFCFLLKILIQTTLIIPEIAEIAFVIRNFTIAFIHLIFLGIVTIFMLGFGFYKGSFNIQKRSTQWGMGLILAGFILSELLLFSQGTMFWMQLGFIPYYYLTLFSVSALIPIGLLLVLI